MYISPLDITSWMADEGTSASVRAQFQKQAAAAAALTETAGACLSFRTHHDPGWFKESTEILQPTYSANYKALNYTSG